MQYALRNMQERATGCSVSLPDCVPSAAHSLMSSRSVMGARVAPVSLHAHQGLRQGCVASGELIAETRMFDGLAADACVAVMYEFCADQPTWLLPPWGSQDALPTVSCRLMG